MVAWRCGQYLDPRQEAVVEGRGGSRPASPVARYTAELRRSGLTAVMQQKLDGSVPQSKLFGAGGETQLARAPAPNEAAD
jgi:hypothetical protein